MTIDGEAADFGAFALQQQQNAAAGKRGVERVVDVLQAALADV